MEAKMNRIEQMRAIQNEALELFKRKNEDYADSFARFGVPGVITRIEDKMLRCISISTKEIRLVEEEKLEDTLLDLHNYAAMALMLLKEDKTRID